MLGKAHETHRSLIRKEVSVYLVGLFAIGKHQKKAGSLGRNLKLKIDLSFFINNLSTKFEMPRRNKNKGRMKKLKIHQIKKQCEMVGK